MEVAKRIGGKIAVTAATAGFVAAVTSFGAKIGENKAEQISTAFSSSSSNTSSNNLLPNIESYLSINENLLGAAKPAVEGLDKYPLNLLTDMFSINISLLVFLFLMLNVFIAIYLKNKDFANYLSKTRDNNKLNKFIFFLYNRYINIWYESRIFILIFSWCMLFIGNLIFMLGFYIILNSG